MCIRDRSNPPESNPEEPIQIMQTSPNKRDPNPNSTPHPNNPQANERERVPDPNTNPQLREDIRNTISEPNTNTNPDPNTNPNEQGGVGFQSHLRCGSYTYQQA
eukprot:TRINITY_DN8877_c0_g1_i1.p2 TRINITY_DN8877_c0_g1~~TRINITY_DN8877_c0_g1_i1.p2  ORF type:complete len:104 (-),score=13.38 TRINITY_DN8877_c0_g1_i1:187-498(-)